MTALHSTPEKELWSEVLLTYFEDLKEMKNHYLVLKEEEDYSDRALIRYQASLLLQMAIHPATEEICLYLGLDHPSFYKSLMRDSQIFEETSL